MKIHTNSILTLISRLSELQSKPFRPQTAKTKADRGRTEKQSKAGSKSGRRGRPLLQRGTVAGLECDWMEATKVIRIPERSHHRMQVRKQCLTISAFGRRYVSKDAHAARLAFLVPVENRRLPTQRYHLRDSTRRGDRRSGDDERGSLTTARRRRRQCSPARRRRFWRRLSCGYEHFSPVP